MIEDITPMMITYNEQANIARSLERLTWARRILVIDSGSTDETLNIIRSYPGTEIVHRAFDNFANQCNFGLTKVTTTWVLSLDADYVLSDELVTELHLLRPNSSTGGYQVRFVYRVFGRALRGTLYSQRIVLYRKEQACYQNEGHSHRVNISGDVVPLPGVIFHDDRKPLARWLKAQQRYAREEAEHLQGSDRKTLSRVDKIRLAVWPAPLGAFIYALILKGCLLDGWPGWYYALQRLVAEAMLALELLDRKLSSGRP